MTAEKVAVSRLTVAHGRLGYRGCSLTTLERNFPTWILVFYDPTILMSIPIIPRGAVKEETHQYRDTKDQHHEKWLVLGDLFVC